jgi:hypothetical protein
MSSHKESSFGYGYEAALCKDNALETPHKYFYTLDAHNLRLMQEIEDQFGHLPSGSYRRNSVFSQC